MPDIAGRKLGPIGNGNPCDHGIAKIDRTPDTLTRCSDRGRSAGRALIERQNLVLNIDIEDLFQSIFESLSLSARGQSLNSISQLEIRDRSKPKGFRRVAIEPALECRIALGVHERGNDIGVENYHLRNLAGRT